MSETRWTVQERTWKDELPELPDEVSALLAPPIVVSAGMARNQGRNQPRRTSGRAIPRAVAGVA
ncbi:hypothetical protein [Dactylosporangium sp. CA-092794]|uniref:hypothetical protein n=1 Tax=Dactylosporangium sp. CA-092794 TaxID=3239929 RepID=UPI003D93DE01